MGEIKDVFPFTSPQPFDLAVVKLQKEFVMVNNRVQPIKLVPQGFSPKGKLLVSLLWAWDFPTRNAQPEIAVISYLESAILVTDCF